MSTTPVFVSHGRTAALIIQTSIRKARVKRILSDELDLRAFEVLATIDEPLDDADDDDDEEGDDAVV